MTITITTVITDDGDISVKVEDESSSWVSEYTKPRGGDWRNIDTPRAGSPRSFMLDQGSRIILQQHLRKCRDIHGLG